MNARRMFAVLCCVFCLNTAPVTATDGMNLEGWGAVATAMGGAAAAYNVGLSALMNNPATLITMPSGKTWLDVAVTRRFLTQDYLMSGQGETRIDCRDQCFACGILPKLKDLRRETPVEAWECPPVSKISDRRRRKAETSHIPISSIG